MIPGKKFFLHVGVYILAAVLLTLLHPQLLGVDAKAGLPDQDREAGAVIVRAKTSLSSDGDTPPDLRLQSAAIQSDDFNSCLLSPFWTHYPGRPGDLSPVLTGTHVSLSVPYGLNHDIWESGTFASRIMQPAADTDFEVEAKFDSELTLLYQTQGVLVEQSDGDALRFEFFSDGVHTRFFAASIVDGVAIIRHDVSLDTGTPPYMRLARVGDDWRHAYSFDHTTWVTKPFTLPFTVAQIGVYGGNSEDDVNNLASPEHTAIVDYFYNTANPGLGDVDLTNTLDIYVVGSGSVAKDPDQSSYACGDVVELTANPAAHWEFGGWSGDLIGGTTPMTMTIEGDHAVTATFRSDIYTVDVTTVGNGSVDRDSPGPYAYGQVVTLTAMPAAGWDFSHWSGALTGTTNPATLTVTGNHSVTATFYDLTPHDLFLPLVLR